MKRKRELIENDEMDINDDLNHIFRTPRCDKRHKPLKQSHSAEKSTIMGQISSGWFDTPTKQQLEEVDSYRNGSLFDCWFTPSPNTKNNSRDMLSPNQEHDAIMLFSPQHSQNQKESMECKFSVNNNETYEEIYSIIPPRNDSFHPQSWKDEILNQMKNESYLNQTMIQNQPKHNTPTHSRRRQRKQMNNSTIDSLFIQDSESYMYNNENRIIFQNNENLTNKPQKRDSLQNMSLKHNNNNTNNNFKYNDIQLDLKREPLHTLNSSFSIHNVCRDHNS